jgi:hypothetical protein
MRQLEAFYYGLEAGIEKVAAKKGAPSRMDRFKAHVKANKGKYIAGGLAAGALGGYGAYKLYKRRKARMAAEAQGM